MADLGNQSSENLGQEQILLSKVVSKNHMTAVNRATVREIMLQHEKTFKEQVQDLHKLYKVQRLLMQKVGEKAPGQFLVASQPASRLSASSDGSDKLWKERSILENQSNSNVKVSEVYQVGSLTEVLNSDCGGESTCKERKKHAEDNPRSKNSSGKKKTFDLEQLPDEDTDDEIEKPEETVVPLQMRLNGEPMTQVVGLGSKTSDGLRSLPINFCRSVIDHVGQDATQHSHGSPNKGASASPSQFCDLSRLSVAEAKIAPAVSPFGNLAKSLPQDMLKLSKWFNKGSDPLGQQGTRLFEQPPLSLEQTGTLSIQPVLLPTGKSIMQSPMEEKFQGLAVVPKDGKILSPAERPENNFNWFLTAHMQDTPVANSPMAAVGFERLSGSYAPSSMSGPVIGDRGGIKGHTFEVDKHHFYPQHTVFKQNQDLEVHAFSRPVLQLTQFQQQPTLRSQSLPIVKNTPQGAGLAHTEGLQKGQQDGSSPWNVLGFGHYYPSGSSVAWKTPYKKPPKLVLKNDGTHLELKLASSPERESNERGSQGKSDSSSKRDQCSEDGSKSTDGDMMKEGLQLGESLSALSCLNVASSQVHTSFSSGLREKHKQASPKEEDELCLDARLAQKTVNLLPNCDSMRKSKHASMEASPVNTKADSLPCGFESQPLTHQAETVINYVYQIKQIHEGMPSAIETKESTAQGMLSPSETLQMSHSFQGQVCKNETDGSAMGPDAQENICMNELLQNCMMSVRSLDLKGPPSDGCAQEGIDQREGNALKTAGNTYSKEKHSRNAFLSASDKTRVALARDNPGHSRISTKVGKDAQVKSLSSGNTITHHENGSSGASESAMPAASMQSTSAADIKEEAGDTSKAVEIRASCSPNAHKDKVVLFPDEANVSKISYPSQTMPTGDTEDMLEHASDSDNVAAAILLSFAPKVHSQVAKKQSEKDTGKKVNPSNCVADEHPSGFARKKHLVRGGSIDSFSEGVKRKSRTEHGKGLKKVKSMDESRSSQMLYDNNEAPIGVLQLGKSSGRMAQEETMNDEPTTSSKVVREMKLNKIGVSSDQSHRGRRSSRGRIIRRAQGWDMPKQQCIEEDEDGNSKKMGTQKQARGSGRLQQQMAVEDEVGGDKLVASMPRSKGGGRAQQQKSLLPWQAHSSEEEEGGSSNKPQASIRGRAWDQSGRRTSRLRSHT